METNPLKQYFRQPAIYVRLPSSGKFYQPEALLHTDNNEYPVLPMTTMDEITYRTPDALFNGTAVTSVIQSCMPNIRDAWQMPSIDVDTVLIAIRIASYGHNMQIATTCPKCDNEQDYDLDLRRVMEGIECADYDQPLKLGDLQLFLRPMTYKDMNENNMTQFEEQKTMQMLQDESVAETDRLRYLNQVLQKITQVTARAIAQNIAMVKTPEIQVTDQAQIMDWLLNCDRHVFNRVKNHVINMKSKSEIKPLHIKCGNCSNEFDQQYTLDMSTFFADAS